MDKIFIKVIGLIVIGISVMEIHDNINKIKELDI